MIPVFSEQEWYFEIQIKKIGEMSCDYFKLILFFSVERREDGRDPTDGVGPLPQGVLHLLIGLAPTQFFLLPFLVKYHWFAWKAIQWPLFAETLFSAVPPSNSLVSVLVPRRAFLSWHGALQGPSTCLVRRFRNCRDTRTLSGVATEVPGNCQDPQGPSTLPRASLPELQR